MDVDPRWNRQRRVHRVAEEMDTYVVLHLRILRSSTDSDPEVCSFLFSCVQTSLPALVQSGDHDGASATRRNVSCQSISRQHFASTVWEVLGAQRRHFPNESLQKLGACV